MHMPPIDTNTTAIGALAEPTDAALAGAPTAAPSPEFLRFQNFLAARAPLSHFLEIVIDSKAPSADTPAFTSFLVGLQGQAQLQLQHFTTFFTSITPSHLPADETDLTLPLKSIYLFLFPFVLPHLLNAWHLELKLSAKNEAQEKLCLAMSYYCTIFNEFFHTPTFDTATTSTASNPGAVLATGMADTAPAAGGAGAPPGHGHSAYRSVSPTPSLIGTGSIAPPTTVTADHRTDTGEDAARPSTPLADRGPSFIIERFKTFIRFLHVPGASHEGTKTDELAAAHTAMLRLWQTPQFHFTVTALFDLAKLLIDGDSWEPIQFLLTIAAPLVGKEFNIAPSDSSLSLRDIVPTFYSTPLELRPSEATAVVQYLLDILKIYQDLNPCFSFLIQILDPYLEEKRTFEAYTKHLFRLSRRADSTLIECLIEPCTTAYQVIAKAQFVQTYGHITKPEKARIIKDIYTMAMAPEERQGLSTEQKARLTWRLTHPENLEIKHLTDVAQDDKHTFEIYKRSLAAQSPHALLATSCTLAHQVIAKLQIVFESHRIADPRKTDIIVSIYSQALIGGSAICEAEQTRLNQLLAYPENFDIRNVIDERRAFEAYKMMLRSSSTTVFQEHLSASCTRAFQVIAKAQVILQNPEILKSMKTEIIRDIYSKAIAPEDKQGLSAEDKARLSQLLSYSENSEIKKIADTILTEKRAFDTYKAELHRKAQTFFSESLVEPCILAYQVIAKIQFVLDSPSTEAEIKIKLIKGIYSQAVAPVEFGGLKGLEKKRLARLFTYPENSDIKAHLQSLLDEQRDSEAYRARFEQDTIALEAHLLTSCTKAYEVIIRAQFVRQHSAKTDTQKAQIIRRIYHSATDEALPSLNAIERARLTQLLSYPENRTIKILISAPTTLAPKGYEHSSWIARHLGNSVQAPTSSTPPASPSILTYLYRFFSCWPSRSSEPETDATPLRPASPPLPFQAAATAAAFATPTTSADTPADTTPVTAAAASS